MQNLENKHSTRETEWSIRAEIRGWTNASVMLDQRRRRLSNITLALD